MNARGMTVKDIKPKDRRPALERFEEKIERIGECWLYNGGEDQIWIRDGLTIAPWRFAYEVYNGVLAPKHARFRWRCGNVGCCNWEHISLRNEK